MRVKSLVIAFIIAFAILVMLMYIGIVRVVMG